MTEYLKRQDDEGGDGEIVGALRAIYAAPADDLYWRGLEARILTRLTDTNTGWWDELDRWARPALMAAAVLVLTVGIALFRARQLEHDGAYEAVLTPTTLPIETAVRPVLHGQREATFRYLMTAP